MEKTGTPLPLQGEDMDLFIATPTVGGPLTDFTVSLGNSLLPMVLESNVESIAFEMKPGCHLPGQRDWLVDRFLQTRCTHLLFIDGDVRWTVEGALRLLRHQDLPIVGAQYPKKEFPITGTAFKKEGEDFAPAQPRKGLEEVNHVPLGFCLIRRDVLYRMEKPRFMFTYDRGHVTEEPYFFDKARALGYNVMLDHDASWELDHVGPFRYNFLLLAEDKDEQPAEQ